MMKQVLLIDKALNNLRWIHPNIKMAIISLTRHNKNTIRDLKQDIEQVKELKGLSSNLSRLMNGYAATT